MNKHTL